MSSRSIVEQNVSASAQQPCAGISLNQLKPGETGVVRSAHINTSDAAMLGAMGLCCNATVRLCRAGEPCIVAVMGGRGAGCRIGLARPLADRILVERLDAAASKPA